MKPQASVQMGRTHPQLCNRSLEKHAALAQTTRRLMMVSVWALLVCTMVSCESYNEYQRWVTYHEAQRQGHYGYNGQYAPGYLAQYQPARQPIYQRPPVAAQTARSPTAQKTGTSVVKKSKRWDYYSRLDTRTTTTFPEGLYWVIDRKNYRFYYPPAEYKRFKEFARRKGKVLLELDPYHGELAGVPSPP